MVPYEFSLNLPLSDLGRSLKGHESNLSLLSNRIALFHFAGSSSKVARNVVGQHKARFTLVVKAEKDCFFFFFFFFFWGFNLPSYGPDLAPRQKKNSYQFERSIGTNVVIIKYYCF
jgi:hypothetical protein